MNPIDLSVIVCTLNRSCLLEKCLESLETQEADQFTFETIVVDNGSVDGTKEVTELFKPRIKNLHYVSEPQKGLGRARNSGFQTSQGRFVAYIDDDAQASPEWCATICRSFDLLQAEGKSEIAALGGPSEPLFEGERPEWFSPEISTYYAAWSLEDQITLYPPGLHPIGANCAFRRDVLLKNPWNTELLMLEDVDLFRHLHQNGYVGLYIPRMRIKHFIPQNRLNLDWLLERRYTEGIAQAQTFLFRERLVRRIQVAGFSLLKFICFSGFSFFGTPERKALSRCKKMTYKGFLAAMIRRHDLAAHSYLSEKWESKK